MSSASSNDLGQDSSRRASRTQGAPAREFFSEAVDAYETTHYGTDVLSFMSERLALTLRLVDQIAPRPEERILEGGCGPGHLSAELAYRGRRVVAMDASRAMLTRTRQRLSDLEPDGKTTLARADIEVLPFATCTCDVLLSNGVIEYLADDERALSEFCRVLKPGGTLLVSVTNAWSHAGVLDFAVEFLKRRKRILDLFNRLWTRSGRPPVRGRAFRVRKHQIPRFRRALAAHGFEIREAHYFHFLPWPHPFDRLFPGITVRLCNWLRVLARTPLAFLGEGYLVVAVKREPVPGTPAGGEVSCGS